ncbi:polysaccharide deacetylase family protein [Iocasia frigidifontis]|uniref:Polysaccharide deacetylase family protein n=1 Tax=Iocasia fonsfrigidae TaxID=2682810 RepID=A0A8A7KAX9_9FIRM|nr:polysaccharide deacetylase family protein [Iocasia fonsfrigidae]QTL98400.1 polysaccharide deacetylase family protein [Iocasia fonsfrigidae]
MSRIFVPSKKNIIIISTVIFILLFAGGFLLGNKYGEVIPVINQKLVPIYKVNRHDQKISITLDGTWGAEHTEEILKIFKENDVKITFFFAGYWLKKYPDLVKKIAADGHEIGNHTFTHPHCNSLSREKLSKELEDTSNLIKSLIGSSSPYFRPPYGEYNNQVIRTANELGYQVIQWSIDSLDWKEPGVDYIVDRVINNVESGDIILMHNNAPDTPASLKILLPKLKEMGYSVVPLSAMVYKNGYYIESHSGLQCKQTGRGD